MNEDSITTRPQYSEPEILRIWGNPNQQDDLGFGPLHKAIKAANPDPYVITVLTKHCANIDMPDKRHRTPLHWAAQLGHLDIVLLLLELGANPRAEDIKGLSAAQRARDPEIRAIIQQAKTKSAEQAAIARSRSSEEVYQSHGNRQVEEDLKKIASDLTTSNEQLKSQIAKHREN